MCMVVIDGGVNTTFLFCPDESKPVHQCYVSSIHFKPSSTNLYFLLLVLLQEC